MSLLFWFFIIFIVFGGGWYGWYGRANPAVPGTAGPAYGYAPGIGGILLTLLIIYLFIHYVLRLA